MAKQASGWLFFRQFCFIRNHLSGDFLFNVKALRLHSEHCIFQVRLSVVVIPRSDAESSVCNQRHLTFLMCSGCRIDVRHDDYRVPHLSTDYSPIKRPIVITWKSTHYQHACKRPSFSL